MIRIKIKINKEKIHGKLMYEFKKKFTKDVRKFEEKIMQQYRSYIEILAPDGKRQKTGKKLKDIIADLNIRKGDDRFAINAVFDGKEGTIELHLVTNEDDESDLISWVNDGTGIYGPYGTKITPKNRKYLSWVDENGVRHFATSVKGQKPQRFIEDADEILMKDLNSGKIKF